MHYLSDSLPHPLSQVCREALVITAWAGVMSSPFEAEDVKLISSLFSPQNEITELLKLQAGLVVV